MRAALLLTVMIAVFLVGFSDSPAQEPRGKADICELLVLSGLAAEGPAEVSRRLSNLRSPELEDMLRGRLDEVVASVSGQMKEEDYALFIAPMFADELSAEETQRLLKIYREPVIQRWLALNEALRDRRAASRRAWGTKAASIFIRQLSPRVVEGQSTPGD